MNSQKKTNSQLPNRLGVKVAADFTQMVRGTCLGSWELVFWELTWSTLSARHDEFHAADAEPIALLEGRLCDALAVLWSTRRYERGEHLTFGDDTVDARGLPMRVVC